MFGYKGKREWLVTHPVLGDGDGKTYGAAMLPGYRRPLGVIFSPGDDAAGWEHVSVSCVDGTPTWEEMCRVKALFWDDADVVIQFHPPKAEYVNHHPFCLHLWRHVALDRLERPAMALVGPVPTR